MRGGQRSYRAPDSRVSRHIDIEAADQCGVKVSELIFVSIVHGRYHMTAIWQGLTRQLSVEREIHHSLKDLGTRTVQLIEKQDDRLAVYREPVRWGKICL